MSPLEKITHWTRAMQRRRALANAWRDAYALPAGKMIVHDLLESCGLLEVSHTPQDATQTAFQEGRRSVALEILERLRWQGDELMALAQQRQTEKRQELEDYDAE